MIAILAGCAKALAILAKAFCSGVNKLVLVTPIIIIAYDCNITMYTEKKQWKIHILQKINELSQSIHSYFISGVFKMIDLYDGIGIIQQSSTIIT